MRYDKPVAVLVAEFLQEQRGLAFCNPCIRHGVAVSLGGVKVATAALAHRAGFDRRVGICARCGEKLKVIGLKIGSG
jgi:hypothetical protein